MNAYVVKSYKHNKISDLNKDFAIMWLKLQSYS